MISKKNLKHTISAFTIIMVIFMIIGSSEESTQDFSRVENASKEQFEGIKFGLKEGNVLSELMVVKSKDFSNIYFAATKINNQIAIWSIGGSNPSMFFSVNDYALKISDYPDGRKTKAQIKETDDGVQLLKDYIFNEDK